MGSPTEKKQLSRRPEHLDTVGVTKRPSSTPTFDGAELRFKAAIQIFSVVLIFENDDLTAAFRKVAEYRSSKGVFVADSVSEWLCAML